MKKIIQKFSLIFVFLGFMTNLFCTESVSQDLISDILIVKNFATNINQDLLLYELSIQQNELEEDDLEEDGLEKSNLFDQDDLLVCSNQVFERVLFGYSILNFQHSRFYSLSRSISTPPPRDLI